MATEFVTIRHKSQPETMAGARTPKAAFESYYVKKGWEVVDAPATDTTTDVSEPSLSIAEQVHLLNADSDALNQALVPVTDPNALTEVQTGVVQDPSTANADEVIALVQAHPEVAGEVATAEKQGKNRPTVVKAAETAAEKAGTQ